MLSIAKLAERDRVSKPTVSIKVKRLIAQHGLQVERDAMGRVSAVNVAHYDMLLARTSDPSKTQASEPVDDEPLSPLGSQLPDPESYSEAKRQKTLIEAERARLELAERKGELVSTKAVADAAVTCADRIVRVIDRLPGAADELASAVAKDGVHGARVVLKGLANKMRSEAADALAGISSATPAGDVA